MRQEFNIDFLELCFLAEACIPPVPIGRAVFWDRLINDYYKRLSEEQRNRLFDFVTRSSKFDKGNEDCQWFYARYNPQNQFHIQCEKNGRKETIKAFRKDDRYCVGKVIFVASDYIVKVEKANL